MTAGIVSVHFADVGVRAALAVRRQDPTTRALPGLRHAHVVMTTVLTGRLPAPSLSRVGLIAFWEDDSALDRFLREDPVARILAPGLRVRLQPLRASGSWPGLAREVSTQRSVESAGPVAALTLGRLRWSQAARFLSASAKAEASVLRAPGLIWTTGLAALPFVSTFSLWRDARSLLRYAYGNQDPAHRDAIAAADAKPFHHESAFVRFRPYASEGELIGANPLAATWLESELRNAAE